MKKIVLSLAGVLAATAFAPEASAIPSFARQTGMACTACHAQHFPVLNSFGRAFKAAGYTMMGAQGKIEGEHLSVPDALNASMLMKLRYQKQNTAATVGAGTTAATGTGDGQWQMFDEFALFFGGRVAENVGFMFEGNVVNGATTPAGVAPAAGAAVPAAAHGGTLLAGFKLPFGFDMGGARLSIIPFSTDALGVQYGYEQSSGGVMRANRWSESRRETSAIQFNADRGADLGAASGFAFVAQNDMGFINLTRWSPSHLPGGNGAAVASTNFKNNYIRVAATPTLGGWASVIGLGRMSGSSFSNVALAEILTDQTFFDAQFQGEVAGKELGVYLQHAKAPAGTALKGNSYNSANIAAGCGVAGAALCASDRKAWTIGADYSVIPHVLSIGAAYRNAKTGQAISAADLAVGRGVNNNAVTVTAVYDVTQNVALHFNYSQYSGNNTNTTAAGVAQAKNNMLLMLEAGF